jgi:hypothetical protein
MTRMPRISFWKDRKGKVMNFERPEWQDLGQKSRQQNIWNRKHRGQTAEIMMRKDLASKNPVGRKLGGIAKGVPRGLNP